MYRLISFFIISTFVSVMLYLHTQYGHHTVSHPNHSHSTLSIPSGHPIPSLDGWVRQDLSGSWLLHVSPKNFVFTPEETGEEKVNYNKGHAHLYINGEKVNRIYGNYYNLDYLDPGTYHIKVRLHANNHAILTVNGQEIGFSQELIVLE
ncbi:hypothetical protein [Ammoniphilus sp. CFH 90114]|uniref:hypothetical protein n=1 Tax=Ammoniphilus sp. CFH 90114 TaxID=2493665 RepID=UPI00100F4B50|nr:hypothetical protein [Ammoniphilus sp. CFH 90114]RXT15474.1 hypothetical protein EIZ39_04585 [Ammoniphilus sp. CFH 90114]